MESTGSHCITISNNSFNANEKSSLIKFILTSGVFFSVKGSPNINLTYHFIIFTLYILSRRYNEHWSQSLCVCLVKAACISSFTHDNPKWPGRFNNRSMLMSWKHFRGWPVGLSALSLSFLNPPVHRVNVYLRTLPFLSALKCFLAWQRLVSDRFMAQLRWDGVWESVVKDDWAPDAPLDYRGPAGRRTPI